MVSQNHRINGAKDADVVHKIVDQVVRIQQSVIAILPGAGVDACVNAITALCIGLASIDDIHIHIVDRDGARPGVSDGGDPALDCGIFSSSLRAVEEPSDDPLMPAMLSGRSCYIDRGAEASMVGHQYFDMHDRIHAIYAVPLVAQARLLGVLRSGTLNPEGIHEEIRMVLDLLAPQFALVIENALLYQQLNDPVVGDQHKQAQRVPDAPSVSSEDLVAGLAHEIKNPLTAISTFMQLFPRKWNDDHFRTSFYPIARDETQRLSRLVNDMLDRGKNQTARLMPVDIQDLVNNLMALAAPVAEQRQLQFQTHFALASSVIRIDEGKIKEAIINLLENAMEATPDAGDIGIRLEDFMMPSGRPAIKLEIQDSGPGIDKEIQAEIFDPYMSTKADGDLPGGTGLGLYIARHTIQAHGGTIEVECPETSGALFRVILPVERRRR